jgi:hypothetical protein
MNIWAGIALSVYRRATGWTVGVHFRQGQKSFLFSRVSRPAALEPTQPPIKPGTNSPVLKRQGYEADHSPPSSAEVNSGGAIPPLPYTSSWRCAYLIKHRDNFIFSCTLLRAHHSCASDRGGNHFPLRSSHFMSLRSIFIISSHFFLGLPDGRFLPGFLIKILYAVLFSLILTTSLHHRSPLYCSMTFVG